MSRTPLIVGNWKMNTSRAEATQLATVIATSQAAGVDVAVCPPFPWLVPVADALSGSAVMLGAQDCWTATSGAFTGAVSPVMLAELCRFVIVGHSERRTVFGETNEIVAEKLTAALAAGLQPILCVGENLDTRQSGEAVTFVREQVKNALQERKPVDIARCVIAYEPIWAIGTGLAAEASDAEAMAADIRATVADIAGQDIASGFRILYGGSVNASNAAETLGQQHVDGALVGGASLKADSFLAIVRAAI